MNRSDRASNIENLAEPLRAIAELGGGVAFIVDCRSGALVYLSASVDALLGYGRADFDAGFGCAAGAGPLAALCAVMAERVPGAGGARAHAIDCTDPATAGPLLRETTQQHRDGRLVPLAVASVVLADAAGAPAWLAGSLRDLSARDAQAAAQRRF